MELTEFLLARLEESASSSYEVHNFQCLYLTGHGLSDGWCTCAEPARVLAEVAAKRRIVELHEDGGHSQGYTDDEEYYGGFNHACTTCGYFGEYGVAWPCPTMRLLAMPYASHPGYREDWKP